MASSQPLPQFLEHLHKAFKAQQHYTQDHAQVQQSMDEVMEEIQKLLSARSPRILAIQSGRFMHEGKPVLGAPNASQALLEEFAARRIGGLVFHQGVSRDDLQLLFFVLDLKPARLEEMGGAHALLLETNVAVLPWEDLAPGDTGATAAPPPDAALNPSGAASVSALVAPGSKPVSLPFALSLDDLFSGLTEAPAPPSPAAMAEELRGLFKEALSDTGQEPRRSLETPWGLEQRESLKRAGFKVPDFKGLAGSGERLLLGRVDPLTLRESMRNALAGMDPIDQGSILLGLYSFPVAEQALRRGLDYLAPELLAQAIAAVHVAKKPSIFELALIAAAFFVSVKDFELSLEAIRGRLQYEGWGVQEVDQLREAIEWESHGTDTKMRLGLVGKSIFDLDPHQAMIMNRQLVRRGREEDIRKLLSQLNEGFSSPSVERRRQAMSIFADLAECLEEPGLPGEIETRLCTVFREHIKSETDIQALLWSLQAHEALLSHWLRKGQFEQVYQEILLLGEYILPRSALPASKLQAIHDMLARLGGPLNLAILVPMLHESEGSFSIPQLHALFALMGRPAASYLVVCLELEEDRTRQLQLIGTILAIGRHAIPALHDALGSPEPHLVRSAIMILGDMESRASVPRIVLALEHRDLRVRKAAIGVLSRLGGPEAVAALIRVLETRDATVLLETLLALGELKDPIAAAPIGQFLATTTGSGEEALKLRLRAVEALGNFPTAEAVEPLRDLFRKKGFLGGRESTPIRISAAKALAAIGTREAREAMAVILEGEPHEDVRGVLRQFLVSS